MVRIPPPANLDGGKASPAGPISPCTLASERPFLWYERVRPEIVRGVHDFRMATSRPARRSPLSLGQVCFEKIRR